MNHWLEAELKRGIANLRETLDGTPSEDTFWNRYWSGYLKAYESLLKMAQERTAEGGTKPEDENPVKTGSKNG